ncbi:MAG: carbamoylphosphate synthase large subunit [Clostridia bacterium]|nr:carbamoylphosphate synthase large subunit [Clostridia bacterium]
MNVIFLSPQFPPHFYLFCDRLKRLGVNVLGIGDAPYEAIGEACRCALTDYHAVRSLEDYDEVLRAAALFVYKYGKIDYIDSQNEYWLELEARLRTDFDVRTGFRTEDMEAIKRKSRMKEGYARAGVKAARSHLVTDREGCLAFIREVGYPVVAKPDSGVGASNTYKLCDEAEFDRFYSTRPDVLFIMEEFVPGHIETFDGITDAEGRVLFCAGQVMVRTPMDMLHGTGENVSYTQDVRATDLYDIGCRVVRAFGTRNRFFHFEFFRLDEDKPGLGRRGEVLGLEVNMRAPGGYIPDKIDYAYDVDVYQIWAESLVYGENRSFRDSAFRYYVTHVGRSAQISYMHSAQEIRDRYGEWIVLEKEPPRSISGTMGSHVFMLRAASVEQLNAQAEFILMHADGQSWNGREADEK